MAKKKKGGTSSRSSKQKKPSISSGSGSRSRSSSKSSGKSKSRSSSNAPRSITSNVPASSSRGKSKSSVSKGGTPSPAASFGASSAGSDAMAPQLAAVQSRWDRAAGLVALTTVFNAVDSLAGEVDTLDNDVSALRARGFRFGRDWEERVSDIQERWPEQRQQAMRIAEEQRRQLQNSARDVESMVRRAASNHSLINTAESRITSLENSVRAAESRIQGTYDGLHDEVYELRRQLREAEELLDALDDASFDLYTDEHGVAFCKAQWVSDHQEPEGRLFLTDRRLIFEQYEEKATKKILFITTDKELIQEMLWEAPIGAVEELEAEDEKKFLSRKEMLTLRFSERTRELPSDATLQLKGGADNETWRSLIRRVKSGQIEGERFGAPPPEETLASEVAAEAAGEDEDLPTVCPNCNAPLPPIFKGMQQVTCDYCGAVVNI